MCTGKVAGLVLACGVAEESQGALVVFHDEHPRYSRDAERPNPFIIRKADGGFLYATTDLAACKFRVQDLKSDRVVYVVDARQRDHFKDVFDAVRMIGWNKISTSLGAIGALFYCCWWKWLCSGR